MTDDNNATPVPVPEVQPPTPEPPKRKRRTRLDAQIENLTRMRGRGILNTVGHKVSIDEIDKTLEQFSGDRGKAANHLQLTRKRINEAVNQNKVLKARWGKYTLVGPGMKQVLRGEVAAPLPIGPPIPVDPNTPPAIKTEAQIAAAVAAEDDKIKKGLHLIGLNDKEVQLAVSLRNFVGRHIEKTVDMATAGLSRNMIRMLGVLETLEERMQEGKFKLNDRGEPSEEAMVRSNYKAILEEFRKTADMCMQGTFTKAKLEMMHKEQKAKAADRAKPLPGFRPKSEIMVEAQVTS